MGKRGGPKAENGCLKRSGAGPWRKSLAKSQFE